MATHDEKMTAVTEAVNALSSAERQNSAQRFIAMFDAMAALLPPPPAPAQPSPEATLVLSFTPTDEIRPDVERVNGELVALVKRQLAAMPDKNG